MTESTGTNQRRTFRESWKSFDQKSTRLVRKYGPGAFQVMSACFLGIALIFNLVDAMDQSIYCLILSGLTLGYAVSIPVLIKHKESEAARKD